MAQCVTSECIAGLGRMLAAIDTKEQEPPHLLINAQDECSSVEGLQGKALF